MHLRAHGHMRTFAKLTIYAFNVSVADQYMAIYTVCLFTRVLDKHLLWICQLYARLPLLYSISRTAYVLYIREYVKECSGNICVSVNSYRS